MGGAIFSLSCILGQIIPFVALSFYSTSTTVENKLNPNEINIALIVLACCWGLSVIAFFGLIDRDKWGTFFGTTTGRQAMIRRFRSHDDPAIKTDAIFVFFGYYSSYKDSFKNEVIAYMHDNWAEWERTQPEWFTPKFIASVGDEFIPKRSLRELNRASVDGVRAKRESLNLSGLVRNSLGGREAAVADAAAAAISAEEREKSQRRLSLSLRTGRLSNE